MDKSDQPIESPKTLKELGSGVVTSTPLMKSEIGRKLIKQQFETNLKNISQDIAVLELRIDSINLETPKKEEQKEPLVFHFNKEALEGSSTYEFHTPKTISMETIEKYHQLFEQTPKIKIKRIRL